jgi:hypothetical protein
MSTNFVPKEWVGYRLLTTAAREHCSYNYIHLHTLSLLLLSPEQGAEKNIGIYQKGTTGGWREMHNKELHNLHSTNTNRIIKSRRMKWVHHIVHIGKKRNAYKF